MAVGRRGPGLFGILMRCVIYGAITLVLVFVGLFLIDTVAPPVSTLMLSRTLTFRGYERDYVPLTAIAPVLVESVVASEDSTFCGNDGVDWDSLHQVMQDAESEGPSRGASTITMQTARNLFLWPVRWKIRKAAEIAIALGLDKLWSKQHTVEVYLNIAEWGDGIFGVEAAARHYFHKAAAKLDAREAALLATALPNPFSRDAGHPRPFQRRLASGIVARARGDADWKRCLRR